MKKWFSFIIVAAITAFSCNRAEMPEENTDDKQIGSGTYVFSLTASLNDEITKSDYSASGAFTWSNGDQISVLFNDGAGNDKYYTLTAATGGSSSATFSGTIDDGWTIGASDTGKKWALFPAGLHTYNTTDHLPLFRIAGETDFTATHRSANIPMIAELPSDDATNSFEFKLATGAVKFTFTGLKYTKVKLIVENQQSRPLSGLIPVKVDSRNYLNFTASGAVGSTNISFIDNAIEGTVSFYVPFQNWRSDFQPKLTLVNLDDGSYKDYIILSKTAKSAIANNIGWATIMVMPSAVANGVGTPFAFTSKFGIDWNDGSIPSGVGYDGSDEDYVGIRMMKATADASYIYFYFEILKSKLLLDTSYNQANSFNAYFGGELDDTDGDWKWSPKRKAKEKFVTWLLAFGEPQNNSSMKSCFWGDYLYVEYRYARSKVAEVSPLPNLTTDATAYVGMISKYGRWHNGTEEQKIHSNYLYAPKTSVGYLVIDLPTYVAP